MDPDSLRLRSELLVHAGFVRALARAALRGDPESEDLEQDVWVAALEGAPEDPGRRRSWLAAVVRNRAVDVFRGRSRRATRERAAARPEAVASAADLAARAETGRRLVAALLSVEEPYRTTLLLRFHEGLAPRDAAARLSVPVETVRTRTRRGLERLRARLEEEGTGPRAWGLALAPLVDPHAPAGTAAATAAAVGGGIAVKKVVVAVAALLLVAGGATWIAGLREEVGPADGPAPREVAGAAGAEGAASLTARAGPSPAAETAPDVRRPRPVPAGPSIRGRVVDGEGKPIARAWVAAFPDDGARVVRPDEVDASGAGATNFSGADGRFEVAAAGATPFFQVVGEAEGFGAATVDGVRPGSEIEVVLAPAIRLVGRVLDAGGDPVAGARVSVHVLVDVLHFERSAVSDAQGRYRVEGIPTSAARSAGASAGPSATAIRVEREGFAPLYVSGAGRVGSDPTERTMDLVLVRGATLAGRVVADADGTPVADARVVLVSIEGHSSWGRAGGASVSSPWSPRILGETRSGADGSFRFEHVPAQGFHRTETSSSGRRGMTMGQVGAWKEGWAWQSDEVPVTPDGGTIEAEVRLRPAAAFSGRVVDGEKRPIAGARVNAMLSGAQRADGWVPKGVTGVPGSHATTAEDGTYRIEAAGMSPGRARAKVTARTLAERSPSPALTVDADSGRDNPVPDLVVEGEAFAQAWTKARLLVRDAAGGPLWGARFEDSEGLWGGPVGSERSDREGRLAVELPPRNDRKTRTGVLRLKGYAPTPVAIPPEGSEEEIVAVLLPARRVAGRVLHADRSPAASASVVVLEASAALSDVVREGVPISVDDGPREDGRRVRLALTHAGPDGGFSFDGLPEGPYTLLAQAHWNAARGSPSVPVVRPGVASGATDVELILTTPPPRPTGILRGTVVSSEDGRPVASFETALVRRREASDPPPAPPTIKGRNRTSLFFAGPSFTMEKTSVGRFEARGLDPGTYDLDVTAAGFLPARVEGIAVAGGDVELPRIALSRGLRVRGTARRVDGGSMKDLSLSFWARGRPRPTSAAALLRPDGTFEATGFSAGRWRVQATAKAQYEVQTFLREGDADVELDDVGDARVDLALVLAGTLTIQLSDPRLPAGGPFAEPATPAQAEFGKGSRLTLETADHHNVFTVSSLEAGLRPEETWRVLLPGTYVVRLERPREEAVERRVELGGGARVDVVFVAPK